jgi:hypothetical protein
MYGFSHVSVYLSIFEMRNRNFLFHGRTREPLAQPETTSTHRTLAVTHGKPRFLGLCCRPFVRSVRSV